MDKKNIEYLLNHIPQNLIGVLGDFCVDVYWPLAPERGELSIETGLMTIPVAGARYSPGGAGNIVENLRGLNVHNISCFGTVAADPFGCWLRNALNSGNQAALLEIPRKDYHTPVYCKPLLNGVEQNRFDLGNVPLTDAETMLLLESVSRNIDKLNVLIINEQLTNGIHNELFRREFALLVRKYAHKVRFVFDGRDHLSAYPGATLKINAEAASKLAFNESGHAPEESGSKILEQSNEELVITDGENGCYVFEHTQTTFIPAVKYTGPVDTVGAGDSFTAGFAYALAVGANMVQAAEFATCCSAITVRKLNQTGAPTPDEIRGIL
jgi:sugar/nucleoside kinase (ribokinase family)